MTGLEGRTALVTGGSRGIGRAICLRLANDGTDVAINYANSADAANEVAEEVRALGRRAEVYQADVADLEAVDAMCEQAITDFGQIDILVNNAGIGSSGINRPTITEATQEQWELLLGANLWGPIHMCRALVPHMRAADRSDVIMISSVASLNMGSRMGLYSIGKVGAEALAHTLAKEEREHGMRVNIVAPGLVDTDMGRKLITLIPGSDDMRERDASSPFGFVCTPADIAAEVAHLVSDDGRYITNQRIYVNGGGF
ncbi:MAG: glucose 1-dehydrogenase/3-oxoacyl-[acyl-carrier protein] reductase [Chloroflexi bacterium]|jgi:3-oxoacyl-[acyl-carrier protein] reductase|nr:MAG: glucose 1-dehydrogenase/3-oxoacyl-[acyl-carrier protein] reductase [Chloroflexota bacterium]